MATLAALKQGAQRLAGVPWGAVIARGDGAMALSFREDGERQGQPPFRSRHSIRAERPGCAFRWAGGECGKGRAYGWAHGTMIAPACVPTMQLMESSGFRDVAPSQAVAYSKRFFGEARSQAGAHSQRALAGTGRKTGPSGPWANASMHLHIPAKALSERAPAERLCWRGVRHFALVLAV